MIKNKKIRELKLKDSVMKSSKFSAKKKKSSVKKRRILRKNEHSRLPKNIRA